MSYSLMVDITNFQVPVSLLEHFTSRVSLIFVEIEVFPQPKRLTEEFPSHWC